MALRGQPLDNGNVKFANNVNGGGVTFSAGNGNVNFESSVGRSHLGTGVIQLVQVMGNNNLVIANTNVTLNIKNLQPLSLTGSSNWNIGGLRR